MCLVRRASVENQEKFERSLRVRVLLGTLVGANIVE